MKNFLIVIVEQLLKKNKIQFDQKELTFQIKSHPSYPSLHSITGVLDHFSIENIAANVPVNIETLIQLPNCFIAQINNDGNKELCLVETKKADYYILKSSYKKEKITAEKFLKIFTGIIVAVEQVEENNQEIKSNNLTLFGIGFVLLLASFFIYENSYHSSDIVYFSLCLLGFITSIAIIKQDLGLKTSLGNAFCSGVDDKKDCDAVLSSKGAEIFKDYKLSDLSVLYFAGLSVLTFTQISNPIISFSISLLAIPATFYSIYYQYVVVKKWCLLCLSIVTILWLQALSPLISGINLNTLTSNDLLVLGIVSLVVLLVWDYLKPLIIEMHSLRNEKIEDVKFKRNYILFESLLNKSLKIDTKLVNSKEIVFGNLNSNLEIIIITNPFCRHCKSVHSQIDKILLRYHNNVKVKVRFSIRTDNKDSDAVKITSRLIEIYNTKDENECLLAMNDIYMGEKPSIWFKKWGYCKDNEKYILELEKESNWCKSNAINFTPEILINGKSFPKEYNRADLFFFIEDLEENIQVSLPAMV